MTKTANNEAQRLRRLIKLIARYPLGMPAQLWKRVLKEAARA